MPPDGRRERQGATTSSRPAFSRSFLSKKTSDAAVCAGALLLAYRVNWSRVRSSVADPEDCSCEQPPFVPFSSARSTKTENDRTFSRLLFRSHCSAMHGLFGMSTNCSLPRERYFADVAPSSGRRDRGKLALRRSLLVQCSSALVQSQPYSATTY